MDSVGSSAIFEAEGSDVTSGSSTGKDVAALMQVRSQRKPSDSTNSTASASSSESDAAPPHNESPTEEVAVADGDVHAIVAALAYEPDVVTPLAGVPSAQRSEQSRECDEQDRETIDSGESSVAAKRQEMTMTQTVVRSDAPVQEPSPHAHSQSPPQVLPSQHRDAPAAATPAAGRTSFDNGVSSNSFSRSLPHPWSSGSPSTTLPALQRSSSSPPMQHVLHGEPGCSGRRTLMKTATYHHDHHTNHMQGRGYTAANWTTVPRARREPGSTYAELLKQRTQSRTQSGARSTAAIGTPPTSVHAVTEAVAVLRDFVREATHVLQSVRPPREVLRVQQSPSLQRKLQQPTMNQEDFSTGSTDLSYGDSGEACKLLSASPSPVLPSYAAPTKASVKKQGRRTRSTGHRSADNAAAAPTFAKRSEYHERVIAQRDRGHVEDRDHQVAGPLLDETSQLDISGQPHPLDSESAALASKAKELEVLIDAANRRIISRQVAAERHSPDGVTCSSNGEAPKTGSFCVEPSISRRNSTVPASQSPLKHMAAHRTSPLETEISEKQRVVERLRAETESLLARKAQVEADIDQLNVIRSAAVTAWSAEFESHKRHAALINEEKSRLRQELVVLRNAKDMLVSEISILESTRLDSISVSRASSMLAASGVTPPARGNALWGRGVARDLQGQQRSAAGVSPYAEADDGRRRLELSPMSTMSDVELTSSPIRSL